MLNFKNEAEKQLFLQMMSRFDRAYDEKEHALSEWRGEHGYHSTLVNQTVHSTRNSLTYAYQLLNRDAPGDRQRAADILHRILPLQDTDPSHKTYGIWAYFTEEPLSRMAPPDWNWADFCGKELLHILIDHSEKLSTGLSALLKAALLHACNSIRIRDMGPGYTNISVMGTYVTLVSGEQLGEGSLVDYAKKRLKTLHAYNMGAGAYAEYNSPTYTLVLASDLARMLQFVQDAQARTLIEELNDLAWKCIAEHFHFATSQWTGPHARAYTMLQNKELLMQIQRALDYRIQLVPLTGEGLADLLPLDFFSIDLRCPQKYVHCFTGPNSETEVNLAFAPKDIATAYLNSSYTIGNFYHCTFWNQKRNMLCYYGTSQSPSYCALRLLHDFYDYSSGVIVTAQKKNRCVSLIGFITDGGDTHCSLDMVKNATISARDLRLRFEFGGSIERLRITSEGNDTFIADDGHTRIRISVPYAKFGTHPVRLVTGEEKGRVDETGDHRCVHNIRYVDIIFYQGEERPLCFSELRECACAVAFEITDKSSFEGGPVQVQKEGSRLTVSQEPLQVRGSCSAVRFQEFCDTFTAWIDGREYQEIFCSR